MKLVPVSDRLADYLDSHSTALQRSLDPEKALALTELRRVTNQMTGREMQIAAAQGSFMYSLAKMTGARRCLEIGCFTGYSAISVAAALPNDGLLVTIDKDESAMTVARSFFKKTGQSHKIRAMTGNALSILDSIEKEFGRDSFDMAFIDADKLPMLDYFEVCMRLVRAGGIILADNTLWSGAVIEPAISDQQTEAIRNFNDAVSKDPRVEATLVNVADGIMVLRKNGST